MTVTYSNSFKDFKEFRKFINRKIRKFERMLEIIIIISGILFFSYVYIGGIIKSDNIIDIIFCIFALLVIGGFILFVFKSEDRKLKKSLTYFSEITVTLKNEVFETSRSTETNLIEYKAVGEISRCKSCFIVLFKEDNYRIPLFSFINRFGFVRANVIPLSAFESEEQADAFFDMLKGKTVQSSGGLL